MDLARINITDYDRFESYIENVGAPDFPLDRFYVMLLHLPRPTAVNHLRRATRHSDREVTCRAIDLLARLSPVDACPRCFDLLQHPDSGIRLVAVRSLRDAAIQCEDAAARHLQKEEDGDVRLAWVDLLGDIGTDFALRCLREVASTDTSVDFEGRPIRHCAERVIAGIEARMQSAQ